MANRHRISWENGRSCAFDSGGRLAFETRPEERIPKGICGFGEASYNWYHWLIEILPTIMMAQKLDAGYDDLPLLVPEEALTNATFRETLAFFQGNREIVSLKKTHQYRVGELIFIPPPAYGPFNMHRGYWPNPSDYSQNIDVLKQFRMRILDQLALPKKNDGPRRIFLARPANARQYNQDELTNAAHDMGFDIVRMETLSFREQAHLLHAADLVVGPSGAAWAGSLFMRPGTKGLAWVLKEYKGGSFFSNLSCVSGSQLAYLLVDADQDISGTHDAIAAPYTVPVDTFVQHVKALET
ncbi:glycosyltransferase family 61 protein [Roseobacter sp. EG26]|uniref:glycosyltransferase family 61 protein n=1 Tax=Roseobacter sp. EG26 TaxID=3412477 RepID=UPI003CE49844